jgi:hypothetical protein
MSAKPQESISGRGEHWEKVPLGTLYRTIMLENVSVDVVDGARVKGVLGCPSVPGRTEGVKVTWRRSYRKFPQVPVSVLKTFISPSIRNAASWGAPRISLPCQLHTRPYGRVANSTNVSK